MATILVIDDNRLDRKIAVDSLSHAGFGVYDAADGPAGLRFLYERRPDLVLLDVVMPSMDGWTVCERIRELCDVPIVMLTSLNREEEMVRGLNLGADDFVSKPISPNHLVARINAVLRRVRSGSVPSTDFAYDDGSLRIDGATHEVTLEGAPIGLTPTEFRLLSHLARAPDQVHTYEALLQAVWGPEYVDDIDFLRVYVWRLRKKLESGRDKPALISNERGFGYRFLAGRRVR
jgi:DNA-binding response OmpR family regulator